MRAKTITTPKEVQSVGFCEMVPTVLYRRICALGVIDYPSTDYYQRLDSMVIMVASHRTAVLVPVDEVELSDSRFVPVSATITVDVRET